MFYTLAPGAVVKISKQNVLITKRDNPTFVSAIFQPDRSILAECVDAVPVLRIGKLAMIAQEGLWRFRLRRAEHGISWVQTVPLGGRERGSTRTEQDEQQSGVLLPTRTETTYAAGREIVLHAAAATYSEEFPELDMSAFWPMLQIVEVRD